MRKTCFIFLVAAATTWRCVLSEEDIPTRDKKLITTFQVVRFPNDPCTGSSSTSRNGTCYTSAECSDKGGSSQGSCADGFGVCCTFTVTACAGGTVSENITYWDVTPTVSTTAPSSCSLKVCPKNTDVCQLRIDFSTFVITGPSTTTVFEHFKLLGNVPRPAVATTPATGDHENSWASNCMVDSFTVNAKSSANTVPVICGTNTGYHMYVDTDMDDCNTLTFRFSAMSGSTTIATKIIDNRGVTSLATRDWDMTIYQYECGDILQAPPGCTQYFYGEIGGKVITYNYGGSTQHLANQNQKVCIRRERGYCWACFADDNINANFSFAGNSNADNAYTVPTQTCGYGCEIAAGIIGNANNQCGAFDCVIIPGLFAVAATSAKGAITAAATTAQIQSQAIANANVPAPPHISSRGTFGIGADDLNSVYETIAGATTRATLCTKHYPFMVEFKSDGWEGMGVNGDQLVTTDYGVSLPWWQVACG